MSSTAKAKEEAEAKAREIMASAKANGIDLGDAAAAVLSELSGAVLAPPCLYRSWYQPFLTFCAHLCLLRASTARRVESWFRYDHGLRMRGCGGASPEDLKRRFDQVRRLVDRHKGDSEGTLELLDLPPFSREGETHRMMPIFAVRGGGRRASFLSLLLECCVLW